MEGSGGGSSAAGSPDLNQSSQDTDHSENEKLAFSFHSMRETERFWEDVSRRMQQETSFFSSEAGTESGALIQNLAEVNRERYDYSRFLRRFAVLGESAEINDNEYDPVFYTYGLRKYGNLPLVEPLEWKESKRIREFVIAIDTSGSVAGETVQRFVEKTYNILLSTQSFFRRINLHILQCDASIQEDKKITSQIEFLQYMNTMKLRGFGGTDFRPVFEHVDELQKAGEFRDLQGLIYFTDGQGIFPLRQPSYKTVFVFLSDSPVPPEVPPWAIRLVLKSWEI